MGSLTNPKDMLLAVGINAESNEEHVIVDVDSIDHQDG